MRHGGCGSVFQLFLFEKAEKEKRTFTALANILAKRQLITEKREITHFILNSSYSHCCFREAVIYPEIFMSWCVVFALPGASFCKWADCIHKAPRAQVQGAVSTALVTAHMEGKKKTPKLVESDLLW